MYPVPAGGTLKCDLCGSSSLLNELRELRIGPYGSDFAGELFLAHVECAVRSADQSDELQVIMVYPDYV